MLKRSYDACEYNGQLEHMVRYSLSTIDWVECNNSLLLWLAYLRGWTMGLQISCRSSPVHTTGLFESKPNVGLNKKGYC